MKVYNKIFKTAISFVLSLVLLGTCVFPAFALEGENNSTMFAAQGDGKQLDPMYQKISISSGQFNPNTGKVTKSQNHGYVVAYALRKGHTLSISDTHYVFSVHQLVNGSYKTELKEASTGNFIATEDMTVAMMVTKADESAITAKELASVVIYDSQYGMIGVDGYVERFTVEAEKIGGGTDTTRAVIFLPDSYSATGTPTRLIIMTNGYSAHLTDDNWNDNSAEDVGVIKHYMDADYAVIVVDNTAHKTSSVPDLGCPQLVDSYFKAYQYAQKNLNVEEMFSLHSRSLGTFAAIRMMREHPELVKCALMCGPRASIETHFNTKPKHIADRFGFDDTTGKTYEADKVVGYDPYTDVNGAEYTLPPTFWMMAPGDASDVVLETIDKVKEHGNAVKSAQYDDLGHAGMCTLASEASRADALAFLAVHDTPSATNHRFYAWTTVKSATCTRGGELHRNCADCTYSETMETPALGHTRAEGENKCAVCGERMETVQSEIAIVKGDFDKTTGALIDSDIYGCAVGYELKKGHTLSISDENYVFSVRQLVNGNYNTMLKKQATVDSVTATEDMTVAILVRKPDRSTVTAEELASVVIYDTGYVGHVHNYEGGICTSCGERAGVSTADDYEGKVISILGDSISTYKGYIPEADGFNLTHTAVYPKETLLKDVNETWWMQVINNLDAQLGINDSWSSTRVSNTIDGNFGPFGENTAMASLTRIQNLGANGTPDIILFYGGTTDIGHLVPMGTFNPKTAPKKVDTTSTKWSTLADAYVAAIMRLKHYYPDAVLVAMLPTFTKDYYTDATLEKYNKLFADICEHYEVTYLDLRDSGISTVELPGGIFPNAAGMDFITNAVLDTLFTEIDISAGENVVHSVTHKLDNVEASLGHYKGISEGKSFTETLSADGKLTVKVTMNGVDITDSCYKDGVISIRSVTGDLVIQANGPKVVKNGIYTEDGVMYYYKNDAKNYAGLIMIDGDYYYVNSKCQVVTGSYKITKTNGLMEAGTYKFDKTGKMLNPPVAGGKNGTLLNPPAEGGKTGIYTEDGTMYYYRDGAKYYAGLIQIDGDYYYVNSKYQVVTGNYRITKTNGLLAAETYQFDKTGKLLNPPVAGGKTGIYTEDGTMYYYKDGVKNYAGLIIIDGGYYYVNSSCKVVTGTYHIGKTNDLLPKGYYDFDDSGKMLNAPTAGGKTGIYTEDGVMYYYKDGAKNYAGLIMIDGGYYYVNSSCKVVTGTYHIGKTNDLLPKGYYDFDENGKMVVVQVFE